MESPKPPEPDHELPPGLRLWRLPEAVSSGESTARRSLWEEHPGWTLCGTVLLAGLLAHGLCVRSVFYLDDWHQVVANDWVDRGEWTEAGTHMLTYLTYWLTYAVADISAPAFHFGNLVLHLATALVLAGLARRLLEEGADLSPSRAGRIAWWAGLIFVVHPLCSEVPNYVRARDIELATLFSLLAGWAALRWRRQRRFKLFWPMLTLAAILAATLCKEVGYFLGTGAALLVGFGVPLSPEAQSYRTPAMALKPPANMVTPVKTKLVATPKDASLLLGHWPVALSLTLVGLCIALLAAPAWIAAANAIHHPLSGWYILSEARIFWLSMGRVFVPVHLCSDHQLPWTRSVYDYTAWAAVLAETGVLGWTAVLYFRRRRDPAAGVVGVLLALALLALLHRLANPNAELMVEYRIYPAMAPLCVLLAWGLDRLLGFIRSPRARATAAWTTVTGLVAAGVLVSAQRALTWNSTQSLVDNVLAQYPMQNRARKELQDADMRAGHWREVLRRQPELRAAVAAMRDYNAKATIRSYDPTTQIATHIATEGDCALALAKLGRVRDAYLHLQWALDSLPSGVAPLPVNKSALYYAQGRLEEAVGKRDLAIECFTESQHIFSRPETIRALRQAQIAKMDQQDRQAMPQTPL